MTTPAPLKPYRVDLASVLRDQGREAEADGIYGCPCCGKSEPAALFKDVRDRDDFGGAQFVCLTCASDLERCELVAWEEAVRAHMAAEGQLDDETLNGLRAQRDRLLRTTDHTQLADYREQMGEEAYQAVTSYRAAVRAWFQAARDTGVIGELPVAPD